MTTIVKHRVVSRSNHITVFVPEGYEQIADDLEHGYAFAAGGFTSVSSTGGWVPPGEDHVCYETIRLVTAWYSPHQDMGILTATYQAVNNLLAAGEQAVMVEWDDECLLYENPIAHPQLALVETLDRYEDDVYEEEDDYSIFR